MHIHSNMYICTIRTCSKTVGDTYSTTQTTCNHTHTCQDTAITKLSTSKLAFTITGVGSTYKKCHVIQHRSRTLVNHTVGFN